MAARHELFAEANKQQRAHDAVRFTPNERRLVLYALRSLISAFPGKEDFNPEDWPAEQKEQRDIRRLVKKLEAVR